MNPPPVIAPDRPAATDEPEVIQLTASEYDHAVENSLAALGFTREDLQRQAEDDAFESSAAFMMWTTIRDSNNAGSAGEASS
ncbi:hypothetical protein [Actinoplanes sp. NPDC049265]|uniref:hypothetical protein n=1 Tax=Actinoplanes sp. NPDC049265 TaxID=3363902 RepID=UPI0037249599